MHKLVLTLDSGADPGFDQGGGSDRDRPKLLMVCSIV